MIKVLFVCLGNICRSPLAEGVFMHKVYEKGLGEKIFADSAGTASYHIGKLADLRSRNVASVNGIDLTHKARAFVAHDYSRFDYIVAMDKQNFKDIENIRPLNSKTRVVLMRDYDNELYGGEVPDPYYGEPKDFEDVFNILSRSCTELLNKIITEHKELV